MLIRRSRKLLIQPRKYESIEVSAEIEFDSSSVPKNQSIEEYADTTLDLLLEGEMAEAAAVTQTDSFIANYRYTGE